MNEQCARDTVCPSRSRRLGGFTLLELLVVMTIMIGITTMVLMNTLGGTRSSAYAAAANDVLNSCMLAHQRACLDGKKVYLIMCDATNFVLVRWVGAIGDCEQNGNFVNMHDRYTDLSSFVDQANTWGTNMVLVDTDQGTFATLVSISGPTVSQSNVYNGVPGLTWKPLRYDLKLAPDVTNGTTSLTTANWATGDNYGMAMHASQMLPKGFHFELAGLNDTPSLALCPFSNYISFNPDGTLTCGRSPDPDSPVWAGSPWSLSIVEDIRETSNNRVILQFDQTGKITRTQ